MELFNYKNQAGKSAFYFLKNDDPKSEEIAQVEDTAEEKSTLIDSEGVKDE